MEAQIWKKQNWSSGAAKAEDMYVWQLYQWELKKWDKTNFWGDGVVRVRQGNIPASKPRRMTVRSQWGDTYDRIYGGEVIKMQRK